MARKKRLAHKRNVPQKGNAFGRAGRKRHALQGLADEGREPRAKDRHRKPRGVLVCVKPQREKAKDCRKQHPHCSGRGKPQQERARRIAGAEPRHGAHQHDALDPEVQDAALFMNENADPRDK